ncbi:Pirin [Thioalkalivibrio nitratireducens DSM 14787]|uniref:Pirin n=1 Tax=Thioalkalivibrio nitratireducens (strain DSM 14787 / UNIQEM 213 / ALEN2) TaxID=1255043 RepID=L0DUK5_THIND|nr:pirin family protein [Thioalkalivibrio nitratireducens]AGA33279.1 Pirin [Thioalkalivibrio nitratireducens DSM 14787]
MKKLTYIKRSNSGHWVGDGFPVRTVFSYHDLGDEISPFLLMDYAGPHHFEPTSRRRGVGAHPHRGFETVTIVYHGEVSHRDTTGAGGTIGTGDVQWMTAGSGLLHEEFHSDDYAQRGGPFEMIQLWVNLPASDKMTAPAYQGITHDQIPQVPLPDGAGTVRVIAGRYGEAAGAARTFTPINVWDMRLQAGGRVSLELPPGHSTALFVLSGLIRVDGQTVGPAELAVLERDGSTLGFEAAQDSVVLLLGGQPLNEPVVGHGPFVMNTREEIAQAVRDFNAGRFGHMSSSR